MKNLTITLTAIDISLLFLIYTGVLPGGLLFYLIMALGSIIPILWGQIAWHKSKRIWKVLLTVAVIFSAIYLWEYLAIERNVESFGGLGLGIVYLLQIAAVILIAIIQIILLRRGGAGKIIVGN